MMLRLSPILFLFISSISIIPAQDDPALPWSPTKAYWKGYLTDSKHIATAPKYWKWKGWVTAGLVTGTTAGLWLADENIREYIQDHKNSTTRELAVTAETFGNGWYTLPGLFLFYLVNDAFDHKVAKSTCLLALENFILTGLQVQVVKQALHRHRPFAGDGAYTLDGPTLDTGNRSFPSGHTAAAFSLAVMFAEMYKETIWVPVLAYSAAGATAYSRMHDEKHWASDVFFGACIAVATGRGILASRRGDRLTVEPGIKGKYITVTYRY